MTQTHNIMVLGGLENRRVEASIPTRFPCEKIRKMSQDINNLQGSQRRQMVRCHRQLQEIAASERDENQ